MEATNTKKTVYIIGTLLSIVLLVSCSLSNGQPLKNNMLQPLDTDIYLNDDGNSFLSGNVLGEIPMEILWSSSKLVGGRMYLDGSAFVPKTGETIPAQHVSVFLIKNDASGKQYMTMERLKVCRENEWFRIRVGKRKIEKYNVAVCVPGCKTKVYKFCQQ